MAEKHTINPQGPWFLADHPALDFINTIARVDGQPHDFWQSDRDVEAWLQQADLVINTTPVQYQPGVLLQAARQLRQIIRDAVQQLKAGAAVDPQALNAYLQVAESHLQLDNDGEGGLQLRRVYPDHTATQQLGRVAEQAATLLTQEDVSRLRACEHPACTLWFYDRTKAHRRRWCSMALCGNRAKVARFRQLNPAGK